MKILSISNCFHQYRQCNVKSQYIPMIIHTEALFTKRCFHHNSNSQEISLCSHPSCNEVIATKFCTCHDSCAVMACAKFCSDMILCNDLTLKPIFYWICITMENGSWIGPQVLFVVQCYVLVPVKFTHICCGCFIGSGTVIWLPQYQWSNLPNSCKCKIKIHLKPCLIRLKPKPVPKS